MNSIGYIITSYVPHHQGIVAMLLPSMLACGIKPEQIVFAVNGSAEPHSFVEHGIHYVFQTGNFYSRHFKPAIELTKGMGVTHWFAVNGTSKCGPRFRELVEGGFDPEADATVAGGLLPMVGGPGSGGRAINDLAMYRSDYLASKAQWLTDMEKATWRDLIFFCEGALYAMAPKQAQYPKIGWIGTGISDVYGRGTPRLTEYYDGIDWYRYKRNWGQMGLSQDYERSL